LPTDTENTNIITRSQLNHRSFSQESAVCTKQDLGRESTPCYVCYHTLVVYQDCRD